MKKINYDTKEVIDNNIAAYENLKINLKVNVRLRDRFMKKKQIITKIVSVGLAAGITLFGTSFFNSSKIVQADQVANGKTIIIDAGHCGGQYAEQHTRRKRQRLFQVLAHNQS